MADRMYLSDDSFRGRRRRRRPPAHSQSAPIDWRQRVAQMNHHPQPFPLQDRSRQSQDQPTQPKFNQNQYAAQMQPEPVSIEVVDLTEDGNDEESELAQQHEQFQTTHEHSTQFDSRPFHDDRDPHLPSGHNVGFRLPPNSTRNRNYASQGPQQDWEDHEPEVEQNGYEQASHETQDWKYSKNELGHAQIPEQRGEFPKRLPGQQKSYEHRHQLQSTAHENGYHDEFSAEPSEDNAGGGDFGPSGSQHRQGYSQRVGNRTASALPRQAHRNAQSTNRNDQHVQHWLETFVPPPATPYDINDQQHPSQYEYNDQENDVLVNVPDSQASSTLDDHANDHDQLLENSEGNNSYSTLNTSFASPPILDQRAHQLKLSLNTSLARIRLNNTQSSKISQPTRFQAAVPPLNYQNGSQSTSASHVRRREELENDPSVAAPAKRQKISRSVNTESAFDPFEPPPSMQRTVRFLNLPPAEDATAGAVMDLTGVATDSDDEEARHQATRMNAAMQFKFKKSMAGSILPHSSLPGQNALRIPPEILPLTEGELQQAKREEERVAAKLARDREKLLEQDEDLQRARREERQAQLRIEMDEAKAARLEEHKKRMAEMEERQRAIDEKAAQHKSEEEKRKAAEAEKERHAKKEREATIREAALQRTIQARKEAEVLKAQKTAAIAALRQELKGPLPPQQQFGDRITVNPRTAPKTPSDRRKEVEEAKVQAKALEPLGLRQRDLEELAKRERAAKQAEARRQKEEKRENKEEAQRVKELRREVKQKEKEIAKKVDYENRPRKRPVKLPKLGAVIQQQVQQPTEAPKIKLGGFLEDDSASASGLQSESESDQDALFISETKETASVSVYTPLLPRCDYHRKQYGKCPVDCRLRISQASSVSSTNTPEPQSALSAPFRGFTNSPGRGTNPASRPFKPKPKQLPSSHTTIQTLRTEEGVRTGGKTLNPEAIAAYLESLRELRGDDEDEDEDEDVESDDEEPIHEREDSPATQRDVYHWNYQVKRKTWHPWLKEEAAEWIVCGKAGYSSLQQANAVADKEATRQRHGYSLQPDTAEWNRKMDKDDMVQIYLDCTNNVKKPGFVKIKVDRQLRTLKNGTRPETKFGWLKTTVWEIRKITTTTTIIPQSPREEVDDLFEEQEPEPEPQMENSEEIEIIDDSVFTNVDEANRKAANLALDLVVSKPQSGRMDDNLEYMKKRQEESEGLYALCDELERDRENGTFEAEIQIEGGSMVKIEVVGRELKGPRNI